MDTLNGRLAKQSTLSGNLVSGQTLSGTMVLPQYIGAEYFHGDYEYTPTQETQTIEIDHLTALENIVINPIPSNYGLITWNGSVLTVS